MPSSWRVDNARERTDLRLVSRESRDLGGLFDRWISFIFNSQLKMQARFWSCFYLKKVHLKGVDKMLGLVSLSGVYRTLP